MKFLANRSMAFLSLPGPIAHAGGIVLKQTCFPGSELGAVPLLCPASELHATLHQFLSAHYHSGSGALQDKPEASSMLCM